MLSEGAGFAATAVYFLATIPMLAKAYRTRDLSSYSSGNLILANVGNALFWIYVSSVPIGPLWLVHGYNTLYTAIMLFWFLRYRGA